MGFAMLNQHDAGELEKGNEALNSSISDANVNFYLESSNNMKSSLCWLSELFD